jgi:hypothetical protein
MNESEKRFARSTIARQQMGWDHLEAERLAALVGIVTKDVLPSFESSFAYTRTLPPRLESGFTKFYEALARGRDQQ